jgi:hypothetical protein
MEIVNRNGYTWYFYQEVPRYLNSEDVNYIQENIKTIKTLLETKGQVVEELNIKTALKSTPIVEIVDIIDNIEYNLYKVNSTKISSPYKDGYTIYGRYAPDKSNILKWIKMLNDLFDILTGVKGQWGYLLCADGYPTIDGKRLVLRGDLIG